MVEKQALTVLFEKYIRKLRITPTWDIRLEFVEDPAWPKTGDIKIDCADRKAIILLNIANPKREENFEEIIVHELMHIKMYPLDQVTESLIVNCFEEGSAANKFAYEQFFTSLEQTVEELAKCFLLEFGENKELSYGRCRQEMSFNDLYDILNNTCPLRILNTEGASLWFFLSLNEFLAAAVKIVVVFAHDVLDKRNAQHRVG